MKNRLDVDGFWSIFAAIKYHAKIVIFDYMRRFDVFEYIDEKLQFASHSEARALFDQKADKHGAKHLVDGILDAGKIFGTLPYDAVSTYSLDWKGDCYKDRNKQIFLDESRKFGVGHQNVCIPLHRLKGEKCGFSFNVKMSDRGWQGDKNEVLSHLFLYAHNFHTNALDIRQSKLDKIDLSERETKVLKWAAKGKFMQDTADILKISQHFVRTYLQKYQCKFSGASKIHKMRWFWQPERGS